jgi:hypothetical protein
MKKDIFIKITTEEYMRIKTIQLDSDERDALAVVKLFLARIEAEERKGMKSHLDQPIGR